MEGRGQATKQMVILVVIMMAIFGGRLRLLLNTFTGTKACVAVGLSDLRIIEPSDYRYKSICGIGYTNEF